MCIFIFYYKLPQDIIDVKPTFHMQGPNTKSKLVAWYPSVMEQRYRRVLISQNKTTIIVFAKFKFYFIITICANFEAAGSPSFQPQIFLIRQIDRSQDNAQDIRLLSLNLISTIPAESCLFLYSLFFYRFNVAKRMTLHLYSTLFFF